MDEYGALKLFELRRRLKAQLVREQPPVVLERVEGLGVAARPVQGHDQLPAEPIAQRLLGYQLAQFTGGKGMPAGREVRVDPVLNGGTAELLQSLRLRDGERL